MPRKLRGMAGRTRAVTSALAMVLLLLAGCFSEIPGGATSPTPARTAATVKGGPPVEDSGTKDTKRLDAASAKVEKGEALAGEKAPRWCGQAKYFIGEARKKISRGRSDVPPDEMEAIEKRADFCLAEAQEIAKPLASTVKPPENIDSKWVAAKTLCEADAAKCRTECAADAGSDACTYLASRFATGAKGFVKTAGTPELGSGVTLMKKACGAGNRRACLMLEALKKSALGCADEAECNIYCDGGLGLGCTALGERLRDGTNGSTKNTASAVTYFTKACGLDDASGCYDLGNAQFRGVGTIRDRVSAEKSFAKSCDLWTKETTANPKEVLYTGLRDAACQEAYGAKCENRVRGNATNRRPQEDATCKKRGIGPIAWSTLDGTDADECINAMMNLGCTEAIGRKVFCCPAG